MASGLVLPPGGGGGTAAGPDDLGPPAPPAGQLLPAAPDPSLGWDDAQWQHALGRVRRAGRAYVWLNLVEQRLRAVVNAVLRPIYQPVHGEDWVLAAAGPTGAEWAQRAAAVREVSRRKGYLLDPADDDLVAFLTIPQLRELMVQHWPCFETVLADRREIELALDELEVARHVVSRNRALSRSVLDQAERAAGRLLAGLGAVGAGTAAATDTALRRLPLDVTEELVGERYADVVAVHPDRVGLQRALPIEELLAGAGRLDAVGLALNLLCQNFSARRLVGMGNAGCRVRLLFINPASSAVRRRERELGLDRGELSRTVQTNIMHMRRVRARLREGVGFEIRVFDEMPRFSAYLVDGDEPGGLGVVQPYLRRARGLESPALVLRSGGRPGRAGPAPGELGLGLFQIYREEFEESWSDSRAVS